MLQLAVDQLVAINLVLRHFELRVPREQRLEQPRLDDGAVDAVHIAAGKHVAVRGRNVEVGAREHALPLVGWLPA